MNANPHTRRFFVADLSGDEIRPDPGEVHHALHVLRLKSGDEVELFDGAGTVAAGVIGHVDRRSVVMRITERHTRPAPEPAIHLAFAAPKGKRIDWLVEKAVELGAASLRRVIFERSTPKAKADSGEKDDKLLARCISAAKQSGLNFLPKLPAPAPLADILADRNDCLKLLGDIDAGALGLSEAIGRGARRQAIVLLIGPEGGLTETERAEALDAGFIPVRIARTTLRSETAAVAMLAATAAFTSVT